MPMSTRCAPLLHPYSPPLMGQRASPLQTSMVTPALSKCFTLHQAANCNKPLSSGVQVHSHTYDTAEIPAAKFTYDLSPIQILVSEKKRAW